MKNTISLIILVLISSTILSQEKIAEFNTTYANVGAGNIKMEIQFQLFDNKLVMNYLDKQAIKMMKKSGLETSFEFPYSFTKEINGESVWYKFQNDQLQIIVTLKGIPRPSVTIKSKDDFTGVAGQNQTYFSPL